MSDTELIDDYCNSRMGEEERLLFEARLLLNPQLGDKLLHQKKTYELIRRHGRALRHAQVDAIHNTLFTVHAHKGFRNLIISIFD